jgi:L-rhamnose mutarotase
MIFRVLIEFSQNPDKKQYLKEHKLLTFRILSVNKDQLIKKYREVHKPGKVWPEITRGIREVGIIDMEIYLEGNTAFMIMDTVPDFDHEQAMKRLADLPRQKEWEEYVSQFQQAGDKSGTPEKWEIVERIFVLDNPS